MVEKTTFYRTSIRALVIDENDKILFTKDGGANKWDLPGGGMNWGESPQICLAREIQEEMALKVAWIAEHPSYFYSTQEDDGVWYAYVIYEAKFEHLNFTPSEECTEIRFLLPDEIKNHNVFNSVKAFLDVYDP